MPRLFTDPIQISLNVRNCDVNNGALAASPFMIIGVMRAAAILKARSPFIERGLVLTNGESLRDGDLVRRFFVFVAGV